METGPELISFDAARRILRASKTFVRKLVKEGLLRVVKDGKERKCIRHEVIQVKEARDRLARYKRIEDQVLLLLHHVECLEKAILRLGAHPDLPEKYVEVPDVDLILCYDMVNNYAATGELRTTPDLVWWRSLLQSLHEVDFKRLQLLRRDPEPYKVFIKACDRIISYAASKGKKEKNNGAKYSDWKVIFLTCRKILQERAFVMQQMEPPGLCPVPAQDPSKPSPADLIDTANSLKSIWAEMLQRFKAEPAPEQDV